MEQAREDVERALGDEETDERYKEPLFEPIEQFMARKFPPAPWLVEKLVGQKCVAIIGAPQKSTKTWLGTEIALAVARGEPVCGEFATKRGRVAYFYAEEPGAPVQQRLRALAAGHGFDVAELNGRVLLCSRGKFLDVTRDADLAWIVASVRQSGAPIDLLMLDPLRDVHSEKEDSSDGMAPVMKRLRVLSTLLDCAVIVPHHTKKNGDGQGWSNLRGSTVMAASADYGIFIELHEKRVDGSQTRLVTSVGADGRNGQSAAPFELTLTLHDDARHVAERAEWSIQRDEFVVDAKREARREAIRESLRAAKVPLGANAIIKRDGKTWVKGNKCDVLKEIRAMARDGLLQERGMKYELAGGAK